jgi:hypothetical protein
MLLSVQTPQPRIAVCLVRVEPQPWGVVITITVNRDVAARRAEPAVRFIDVTAAAATVAEFLGSFRDEQQS